MIFKDRWLNALFKGERTLNCPELMDRWKGKVAVVTGASAGIGAAVVKDLVKAGLKVVGLARREERMQEIRNDLPENLQANWHPLRCDVKNEDDVKRAFAWIDKELGGSDVLVNNAGIVRTADLVEPNNTELIRDVLDTNVMAVVMCTREAFNSMRTRNIDGHIIIVNSIAGHRVPPINNEIPSFNIYSPTKFAITAMVETYRQEFWKNQTKIKITSISPGAVDTEIFPNKIADYVRKTVPLLKPEDISNAVIYALGTPPHVQVHELIIRPIGARY